MMPNIFADNFFNDFFEDFSRPVKSAAKFISPLPSAMKTDIKENESGYKLFIDLPGYKKDDVKAELKDGYLVISAENSIDNDEEDEDGKYIRRERLYGSCQRSFYVGKDLEKEDIKAKFDNGTLVIAIPKKEAVEKLPENKYISIDG